MTRLESLINAPTRGAQRTSDLSFPSPQAQAVGTVSVGLSWIDRQGLTITDKGTNTTFGVQPAGSQWDLYRGRISNKQTGSGTSGSFYLSDGSQNPIYFAQNKSGVGGNYREDTRCWRILAILAFDGSGLGSGDLGLEVGAGMNFNVIAALAPGFRIGPTGNTQVSFQVRQSGGAGLTIDQVVSTTADVNDWHGYELRFIGATSQTDAVVKAFLDGKQVAQASYGAGTLLPNWANGTALGYTFGTLNRGANAAYLAMMGLQVSCAANEDGLL